MRFPWTRTVWCSSTCSRFMGMTETSTKAVTVSVGGATPTFEKAISAVASRGRPLIIRVPLSLVHNEVADATRERGGTGRRAGFRIRPVSALAGQAARFAMVLGVLVRRARQPHAQVPQGLLPDHIADKQYSRR